jgi:hypothetical protein
MDERATLTERKTPHSNTIPLFPSFSEELPSDGCGVHSRSRSERFTLLRVIAVIIEALLYDGCGIHSRSGSVYRGIALR